MIGNRLKHNLVLIYDFETWELAKKWTYISGYNLINRLKEHKKVDIQVIPNYYSSESIYESIFENDTRKYDKVYIFQSHLNINLVLMEEIKSRCNEIVVILTEKYIYDLSEINTDNSLMRRNYKLREVLSYVSKIYCMCLSTQNYLKAQGWNTVFFAGVLPSKRFRISTSLFHYRKRTSYNYIGTLYNEKRITLMTQIESYLTGNQLSYKRIKDPFFLVMSYEAIFLILTKIDSNKIYSVRIKRIVRKKISYLLFIIRQIIFFIFIIRLKRNQIVINLPSMFEGLPGRIMEGYVAGCDVMIFINETLMNETKLKIKSYSCQISVDHHIDYEKYIVKNNDLKKIFSSNFE